MPSTSPAATLPTALSTLHSLLQTFQSTLSSSAPSPVSPPSHPPTINPLSLIYDTTSLLRAQTTKLSLLILTAPFTPSAIATILSTISASILPSLLTGYQICDPSIHTGVMHQEIRDRLRRLGPAMLALLDMVPRDQGAFEKVEKEAVLAATGQVWGVCDGLVELAMAEGGVRKVVEEKVAQWDDLVRDAVAEIEEWDPKEDGEDPFGSISGSDSDGQDHDRDDGTDHKSTNGDGGTSAELPEISNLILTDISIAKDRVLKTLQLVRMLYPAMRKRRMSTFPNFDRTSPPNNLPTAHQVKALDQCLQSLKNISNETDEVAGALYEHDVTAVNQRLQVLWKLGVECVESVSKGWNGEEDKFTKWSGDWIRRLQGITSMGL
ncbi:MAG: hypothetical protein Q9220_001110 [cf. Caloplaca sp. 1 TL-2023]